MAQEPSPGMLGGVPDQRHSTHEGPEAGGLLGLATSERVLAGFHPADLVLQVYLDRCIYLDSLEVPILLKDKHGMSYLSEIGQSETEGRPAFWRCLVSAWLSCWPSSVLCLCFWYCNPFFPWYRDGLLMWNQGWQANLAESKLDIFHNSVIVFDH